MVAREDPDQLHRYAVRCSWTGSTASGYEGYDRTHEAIASPANAQLSLSADPTFLGNPALFNPEQLVVMAASSCQLLSFLAVAASARIDVLGYVDEGEGIMDGNTAPMRLTSITLRPRIRIAAGTTEDRVRHLVEVAHRGCFIANSLRTKITVEPTIDFVDNE